VLELSIAMSIAEMTQEEAEHRGAQVTVVHLKPGIVSGVVADAHNVFMPTVRPGDEVDSSSRRRSPSLYRRPQSPRRELIRSRVPEVFYSLVQPEESERILKGFHMRVQCPLDWETTISLVGAPTLSAVSSLTALIEAMFLMRVRKLTMADTDVRMRKGREQELRARHESSPFAISREGGISKVKPNVAKTIRSLPVD